jgi:predicted MFS family arabinose efflux permease
MPGLLRPLANPVYRRLFSAQVVALIGTGISTVALALLAYDLAGDDAGSVLGIALALKMVAYVTVSPMVAAWARDFPRRRLLVSLDIARASLVLLIPFVEAIWQVYALVFLINACSAGFTPTFQAVIPDVLPDTERYTEALSLSRLAYDLEGLLSPAVAAALLGFLSYSGLFALNGVAFLVSASLVLTTAVPQPAKRALRIQDRAEPRRRLRWALTDLTHGIRIYLATPRLRGLLALSFAAAAASAMVIVNTVVFVRDSFGLGDTSVAWGLAAAGAGSMVVALLMPRLLRNRPDRTVMLVGGALLATGLAATSTVGAFGGLIACWLVLGAGLSLVQTPAGRLIARSGDSGDRPALFAAQFSLSHACWLLTYPLAGILGAALGLGTVALVLAALAALAIGGAIRFWPARDGDPLRPSS